jgi:hypothetical protein
MKLFQLDEKSKVRRHTSLELIEIRTKHLKTIQFSNRRGKVASESIRTCPMERKCVRACVSMCVDELVIGLVWNVVSDFRGFGDQDPPKLQHVNIFGLLTQVQF